MNENEKPLSDKVTEWTARQLSHEAYDRFMQGGWDAEEFVPTVIAWAKKEVAAALRLAEHPTPSPDATEAARAGAEAKIETLPCDVLIAPATVLRKGVLLTTLMACLVQRVGLDTPRIEKHALFPLPTPQPDERDEALRMAAEAVQAKITKAQIQCDKHAPMGGINYLSWFGRLAGLKDALATIAAAKSKGGEG